MRLSLPPPSRPIRCIVISGLDVVSAVEQVGSDSGRTRVPGKSEWKSFRRNAQVVSLAEWLASSAKKLTLSLGVSGYFRLWTIALDGILISETKTQGRLLQRNTSGYISDCHPNNAVKAPMLMIGVHCAYLCLFIAS